MKLRFCISIVLCVISYSQNTHEWELGPFVKQDDVNPILHPISDSTFFCPVRKENVFWESKDVLNPAAFVKDEKIHLLYRAEDETGARLHLGSGTSRIGHGFSSTGFEFERMKEPIFYPDNDDILKWEWEGGCEDPRIVEDESGTYFMTYTAYDGKTARLLVASSNNLVNWTKYGPIFKSADNGMYVDMWSKSGSIVTKLVGEKFIATKINDKYWMYWGDKNMYIAHSEDLINWTPVTGGGETDYDLVAVLKPREGQFDDDLVTPGPQAFIRDDGILLIYNSRNKETETYSAGQVLFSATSPSEAIRQSEHYFLTAERDYEVFGQDSHGHRGIIFLNGLVFFKNSWFLYYGAANSQIAVAKTE